MFKRIFITLDDEVKLNNEIMKIYDSIKEWRSFDNGYANCQYSFDYVNAHIINKKFRKNLGLFLESDDEILVKFSGLLKIEVDYLKTIKRSFCNYSYLQDLDGDGDDARYIDYYLYELGLILRDYDGHTMNLPDDYTESDNEKDSEYYEKDYQVITELKMINNASDFLEKVSDTLSKEVFKNPFCNGYTSLEVNARTSFCFLYNMILLSITKPNIEL
jgi:hypothetical protein